MSESAPLYSRLLVGWGLGQLAFQGNYSRLTVGCTSLAVDLGFSLSRIRVRDKLKFVGRRSPRMNRPRLKLSVEWTDWQRHLPNDVANRGCFLCQTSERESQRKLDDPRVGGRRDLAEKSAVDVRARGVELRRVENIDE